MFTSTNPSSKTWLNNIVKDSDFRIASPQQIEFDRRHSCNFTVIYFYMLLHEHVLKRDSRLILNMDETMLTAKRRLKVLDKKGRLPLIPEDVKVPHLTGCVTFTASGVIFDPVIILPNKKTLRKLQQYSGLCYFCGTMAGWQTKNTFIYYCLILICQLAIYRQNLPSQIRDDRILLIVDGHPSRYSFTACLILYLFNIDLVLLPPHTSHLLQAFDVSVAAPLKTNFKEELILERFDSFFQNGIDIAKQTANQLRDSLIKAFINSLRKSSTIHNIESGFKKSGFVPFNIEEPLSSQFAMTNNANYNDENLLKNYWLNRERPLNELFEHENGRPMNEQDFDINLSQVLKNLKNGDIKNGKALSDVPPLILNEADGLSVIDLN